MTPELQTKLNLIRAECHKAIELGEKATDAPWHIDNRIGPNSIGQQQIQLSEDSGCRDGGYMSFGGYFGTPETALAIVHSRAFAPKAALTVLALLAAIENALIEFGGSSNSGTKQLTKLLNQELEAIAEPFSLHHTEVK